MAAGTIAAPGTDAGPCRNEECGHEDCDATRAMADSKCPYCHEAVGYDRRFYQLDGKILVHAFCYETAVEQKRSENDDK